MIVKASDSRNAQAELFYFPDVEAEAETLLRHARQEAARIVDEARNEAQETHRRAEQAAIASAEDRIERETVRRMNERWEPLTSRLRQAIERLEEAREDWLADAQHGLLELAVHIAAVVIRREIQRSPEIPLALIREALDLAAGSSEVRLRLHPEDRRAMRDALAELTVRQANGVSLDVVEDDSVSPGGCVVQTRWGVIDQRLESRLRRVEEELRDA
ncbi:MAG: FliH/SctL family protein [Planctomycetales bacterium]